jgi:hypothetical protein
MIDFYNEQTMAFQEAKLKNPTLKVEDFIEKNERKIALDILEYTDPSFRAY